MSRHVRKSGWHGGRARRGGAYWSDAMFWVFLEIVLALAIAVGIVWWTLPRKSGRKREDDPKP